MGRKILRNGLVFGMIFVLVFGAFLGVLSTAGAEVVVDQKPQNPPEGIGANLDFHEDTREWIEHNADTPTGSRYTLYNNHGGWWADAEKGPGSDGAGNPAPVNPGEEDDLLCWAATASNMLEWTGWGFIGGMEDDGTDEFFQYYIDHTTDHGHFVYDAIDWWFDGTLKDVGGSTEDVAHAGFWINYTASTYLFDDWTSADVVPNIRDEIRDGRPVGLTIYGRYKGGAHAVTCWGYNYDSTEDPSTDPEDYYLGIWLTDSDSHKHLNDPDDYLRYYEVDYDDTYDQWYMPNYGGGWNISAVTSLQAFPGEDRPTARTGGPYSGYEGSAITFDASSSSDPGSDPLRYRWDFDGDGDWDTSWTSSPTASHTWYDNYYGTVYLEVFDERLRDMATTTVTVNNVAPTISAGDETINENGIATISGSISDPGTEDTFSVQIDWKDGNVQTYNYGAGTTSFSETHQYLDDDPSGTASDDYSVALTITDDDGGVGSDLATVTVNNVAPILTLTGDIIFENDYATLSGTITDVSTLDTFELDVDWGEGAPETFIYPAGTTVFSETHQYLDDNPTGTGSDDYTISVILSDDDMGTDSETTIVTVQNVPVMTTIDSMDQPNPMFILPVVHTLDFYGSFSDVGTMDTHTASWDWGDTSSVAGSVVESGGSGTVTGSHVYSEPGTYTVTLTVTDDDGGADSDTFFVEVVGASEALSLLDDYVDALSDDAFKNNANQRKNAFSNMIGAINSMVEEEEYTGAIQDLQNNVRGKADGTVDGKGNNDWITDGSAQQDICMSIDDITDYLATLL